jgi:hypothetical protein
LLLANFQILRSDCVGPEALAFRTEWLEVVSIGDSQSSLFEFNMLFGTEASMDGQTNLRIGLRERSVAVAALGSRWSQEARLKTIANP